MAEDLKKQATEQLELAGEAQGRAEAHHDRAYLAMKAAEERVTAAKKNLDDWVAAREAGDNLDDWVAGYIASPSYADLRDALGEVLHEKMVNRILAIVERKRNKREN
jgi:hypothetical protein